MCVWGINDRLSNGVITCSMSGRPDSLLGWSNLSFLPCHSMEKLQHWFNAVKYPARMKSLLFAKADHSAEQVSFFFRIFWLWWIYSMYPKRVYKFRLIKKGPGLHGAQVRKCWTVKFWPQITSPYWAHMGFDWASPVCPFLDQTGIWPGF